METLVDVIVGLPKPHDGAVQGGDGVVQVGDLVTEVLSAVLAAEESEDVASHGMQNLHVADIIIWR